MSTNTSTNGSTERRATMARKAFYEAKKEMDRFLEKNEDAVKHLRKMAGTYNGSLDKYKQALRDLTIERGVKHLADGENDEFQVSAVTKTQFHLEPLLAEMSREDLIAAQAIKEEVHYLFREEEILKLVASEDLTQEAYKKSCAKVPGTPSIRAPHKPIKL